MSGPVSAVIVASASDAPHLAVTLPHLVAQARFAFAERVLVLDPRPRRGPGDLEAVARIACDARAAGTIDRIVDLDTSDASRRAIVERYFEPGSLGSLEPTVYAALFAIDRARHDLVAWFEPGVLFHAAGDGWVAAAVHALARGPRVWLAATRGGPPRSPRWLRALVPVREGRTTGHHFVCDRRRLRGVLRHVRANARPLGAHLSDALERHEAFVAIVDGGWHVAARTAAPPFARWAAPLARAIERGEVPPVQRGGTLRLDDPMARGAWRRQLFPHGEPSDTPPARGVATLVERGSAPGPAPMAIVIPIRDRAGADVRNALASLAWQTAGRPAEIIIVSHGSAPAIDEELRGLAREAGATLVTVGSPADAWSKPFALNTGIRATAPAVPFVMTMDGDMILGDNMLETVLAELRADPRAIVLCQSSDLPQGCALPAEPGAIRAEFEALRARATLRATYGTGGVQVLPRSFLFDVRGYDEDMLWWGALDSDMVRRAQRAGLRVAWITDRTAMLHQWHPRKHHALDEPDRVQAARMAWLRNHELMLERAGDVVRNRAAWGAPLASP